MVAQEETRTVMTDRCPKCKAWMWSYNDPHKCPPLWLVQCPEYDDETWDEVYAVAAEYAAESWAEEYDADSHDMMDGETIIVRVKPHEDNTHYNTCEGDVKEFKCSGEAVPTYYSEEIVDDKDGDSDEN